MSGAWNHNTHYHRTLLSLLPRRGESALDVGCGDGSFAVALADRYLRVVALDCDPEQVHATSSRCARLTQVSVRQAGFLDAQLPDDEFDVVTALASLHHMPFGEAAEEAVRVLKPGGRLLVLGVWTDRTKADLPLNVASVALNRWLRRRRGLDSMNAPATLDQTSWRTIRQEAPRHLPGVRLRRRLLWRYTLVWDKPVQ